MAQRRMLDKKISVSEQVANLPLEAQLIFTWAIPHADDIGLLPISHRTLKGLILPLYDMSLETFGFQIEKILEQGLFEVFEWEGEKFYRIVKFLQNQTLKKDRKPNTLAKNINSWKDLETIGFHLEDNGNPREEKLSKEKRIEIATAYLSNIPKEDMKQFVTRFDASERGIKSKAEDLLNYCKAKNKFYTDYKAFLLNALKRDFEERVVRPPSATPKPEPKVIYTPEQIKKIAEEKEKIREKFGKFSK